MFNDWLSNTSYLFTNPRAEGSSQNKVTLADLPDVPNHIWLASSGTTRNSMVFYGLSKLALLTSAKSVNAHLQISESDIWLNALPEFHVGGLSISARAFIGKNKVYNQSSEKWEALRFLENVSDSKVTLTSLVPTQVFDLVQLQKKCPPQLRAIVVGGAKLSESLYRKGRELGYPLLPSFGMTECCSQIATAELSSLTSKSYPKLKLLSHVNVKLFDELLGIKSQSLFTVKVEIIDDQRHVMWRAGDWYVSEDRAQIDGEFLLPLGRAQDKVKISGELVSLNQLNEQLTAFSGEGRSAIVAVDDERRGHCPVAVFSVDDFRSSTDWIKSYNASVLPVAKISCAYYIKQLPKTELGKIKIVDIKKVLRV